MCDKRVHQPLKERSEAAAALTLVKALPVKASHTDREPDGELMINDRQIKHEVEARLEWNPDLDATDIEVSVKEGVVTPSGFARSYKHKEEAEKETKKVRGVRGVANDIEVRLPRVDERPDSEVAREAAAALRRDLGEASGSITIVVRDRWLTLEGEVEWSFQSERAEAAVRRVTGLKGVMNVIRVKAIIPASDITQRIEEALRCVAEVDAQKITVEASGGKVLLTGKVRSLAEREEAERAAWRAPGVPRSRTASPSKPEQVLTAVNARRGMAR